MNIGNNGMMMGPREYLFASPKGALHIHIRFERVFYKTRGVGYEDEISTVSTFAIREHVFMK